MRQTFSFLEEHITSRLEWLCYARAKICLGLLLHYPCSPREYHGELVCSVAVLYGDFLGSIAV